MNIPLNFFLHKLQLLPKNVNKKKFIEKNVIKNIFGQRVTEILRTVKHKNRYIKYYL